MYLLKYSKYRETINTIEVRKEKIYKAKKKNHSKEKTQNKKTDVQIDQNKFKGITFIY